MLNENRQRGVANPRDQQEHKGRRADPGEVQQIFREPPVSQLRAVKMSGVRGLR